MILRKGGPQIQKHCTPALLRRGGLSGGNEADDQGQIMVLVIGFVLIALLLISVVAASSSLYLGQKKLLSLADAAALAGADSFVLQGNSANIDPQTVLTPAKVTSAAQAFLETSATPSSLSGVHLETATGTSDGHTAEVALTGVVHPFLLSIFVPAGIEITVYSTARAQLVQ